MGKLIFEKDNKVPCSYIRKPDLDIKEPSNFIPKEFLRKELNLPSPGELEVVRHYANLSELNFCVDKNFYPLGSCTMKYNPKINEELANLENFLNIHPYQDNKDLQGALELIYNLEKILCEITGMSRFTFQPSSGAQGELTGLLMIKKYHKIKKNKKYKVIVPVSSHGTNPASIAMCGYEAVNVETTKDGLVDIDKLNNLVDESVAAMMLTNPNTLGLFEEDILKIKDIIHKVGAFLYYDGANFNALLGITKPSIMGFDIIHLNLHKTFSTPHGCGGPGLGAVGVSKEFVDFLPVPIVDKKGEKFYLNYNIKNTIKRVRSFVCNFSVLVKAYSYLLRLGSNGLSDIAYFAVLNANYIKERLKQYYELASEKPCMHEVVFSCKKQKEKGITAFDIAKSLIDYGIHPPTIYFPLIVKEAIMIEPTETENRKTLDYFIDAMIKINEEIDKNPDKIKNSPHKAPVRRVDEVKAARELDLAYKPKDFPNFCDNRDV